MFLNDTIVAISTPIGEAGLAVVRLSGSKALSVADRVFKPIGQGSLRPSMAPSHTIHYGFIVRDGVRVDEVLLSVLRAPRTFTREDMVEVSCHGGVLPAKLVLDTILREELDWPNRASSRNVLSLADASTLLRPRPSQI